MVMNLLLLFISLSFQRLSWMIAITVYENYEDCDDVKELTDSNDYRYYSKLECGREHPRTNYMKDIPETFFETSLWRNDQHLSLVLCLLALLARLLYWTVMFLVDDQTCPALLLVPLKTSKVGSIQFIIRLCKINQYCSKQ